MGLIFLMSHHQGGQSGKLTKELLDFLASIGFDLRAIAGEHAPQVLRKSAHVFEYGMLTLWFRLAKPKVAYWITALFPILYACSDEFHQTLIPGRMGLVSDVFVDGVGVGGAILLLFLWNRWVTSKNKSA